VHGIAAVSRTLPEQEVRLRRDGDDLVEAGAQPAEVTLLTGSGPAGGALRVTVDTAGHPAGQPVAPVVAAALSWADQQWDLGLGPLQPAPDVTA
jgi:hypothetical protein